MTTIQEGRRVRVEGVVTYVTDHYVEVRLETGQTLLLPRRALRPVPEAPPPAPGPEDTPDDG